MNSDWSEEVEKNDKKLRPYYNTICDPKFPLFKADGLPVSESLYQYRITGHYSNLKTVENTPVKKSKFL